jgi:hypothetical protein
MERIAIALCITLALAGVLKVADPDNKDKWTDQQWEEYNEAAEKGDTAAGGVTDVTPPHKKNCKPGQYCPTVQNGLAAGKAWCLKLGSKCAASHRNRTYDIYMERGAWFEKHNGGRLALHMASTARTESEGKAFSKTTSSIKEVGLLSIKATSARKLDINACHPEANVWAAGRLNNGYQMKLAKKYPVEVALMPRLDWMKLAGACGAVGSNRVYAIIKASGALKTKTDEEGVVSLVYSSPYDRVLKWINWKANKEGDKIYSGEFAHMFGSKPGLTAFRIARSDAVYNILAEFYPDGFPFEDPVLLARPDHFPEYPGDKQHGQCWRGPEC